MSPKSAWPIRGAHSAWACHAARSRVQEMGPHSSELAVLFAKEKGIPCRTRICNLWLMMLEDGLSPGICRNLSGIVGIYSKFLCAYSKECPIFEHTVSAGKKPINKETHKPDLHGIVPGLSRECPGLFLRFPGNFVISPGRRETHKQFDPHPFPGQSREVVDVYWFFCPPELCV